MDLRVAILTQPGQRGAHERVRERELFLARDRFGIKPLYCYEDRARVVFASEVRAVVTSGLVPDETVEAFFSSAADRDAGA